MTITPWHSQVDFEIAKRHNLDMEQIIDQRGRLRAAAPEFESYTVNGSAQGYRGATPYVRAGDAPVMLLAAIALALSLWLAARGTGRIRVPTP